MKRRFYFTSKRFRKQITRSGRPIWLGASVIWFSMGTGHLEAANTPGVESPVGTMTYTGDQSAGVNPNSNSILTVNVRDLSGSISPAANTAGIVLTNQSAGNITVNAALTGTPFSINTTGNQAQGINAVSVGVAPQPVNDPFLGVPIPTSQNTPGGVVTVNNSANITTNGTQSVGIVAQSSTSGYPAQVAQQLGDFISQNKASTFSFAVNGVKNKDGTSGTVGSAVTASLLDANGNVISGGAGTVTLNADGTFSFAAGSDFSALAVGGTANIRVDYSVLGSKTPPGATKTETGYLVIKVTKTGTSAFSSSLVGSTFNTYGTSGTAFPNLNNYVNSLLGAAGTGGAGNSVTVTNNGIINTSGANSAGIYATSQGGRGGDGSDATISSSSTQGGVGSQGGTVTVTANGSITTTTNDSAGVIAWSVGGDGGTGGDSGYFRNAKAGGAGGAGGNVIVNGSGTIHTSGNRASGILAVSQGGSGGTGGDGSTANSADAGGSGGPGGTVTVNGSWNITTTGDQAHGIWAKSVGGIAGGGGDGGWTGTSAGSGGQGTSGGSVTVTSNGTINTSGADAYGIYAESIGGFGGNGGGGGSIFYASGGSGASAGSGGNVSVTNGLNGTITTTGARSHGIFAQSVGGGGGSGGGAGALVGLGGTGASGGAGGAVSVNNAGTIQVSGVEAKGIYAQSIGGGGGDGGNSGGLVAVGGKGSATSDGGSVAVTNTGTITSTSSAIFAQSVGGGGGNGGSSTGWFSFGGSGDGGGDAGNVLLTSHGNLTTSESNASAIFAQSIGGGGGNGGNSTAVGTIVTLAMGGQGKEGGDGGNVQVGVNTTTGAIDAVTGTIKTTGDFSRGIQAQSVGGGGGNGGFAASISVNPAGGSVAVGLGGGAGGGGDAGQVEVYAGDANSSITTDGKDAHGIFAQSVGGGGGSGGFAVTASAGVGYSASVGLGGTAGAGGDADNVYVGDASHRILGTITTDGDHSYGILAQSVGGGGGDGGFSIGGSLGAGMGGALNMGGKAGTGGVGKDVYLYTGATVTTKDDNSHGVFAQSVGGGGGTGGFAVSGSLAGAAVNVGLGGAGGSGNISGNVYLNNSGTVKTGGTHSYGVVAQSIGGGGGDGGFSVTGGITAAPSLGFSLGGSGASGAKGYDATLINSGNVATTGEDSHALVAQSIGGGGGSGGFSVAASISIDPTGSGAGAALNASIGGSGAAGAAGGNVVLTNTGNLETTKTHSYGILAQSIGGGGGDGGFSIAGGISTGPAVSFSMGGNGAGGGAAGTVTVNSNANITTHGGDSHGILAQSVGGSGGSGGFSVAGSISTGSAGISASIGGKGAGGGDGMKVTVGDTSAISGLIQTEGDNSYGVLAQSVGGGGGDGGFSIAGGLSSSAAINFSLGGSGGGAGEGGMVVLNSAASVKTLGTYSHGLFAQSLGGGGGSGGFSITGGASSSSGAVGASIGGSGGGGGLAKLVTLTSTGAAIITTKDHSDGIHAQSIGGGGGDGGFSIAGGISSKAAVNFSLGGSGGTAGAGGDVIVTSSTSISTSGNDSHGIFAQSVGGGGGSGGFSVTGSISTDGTAIGASLGGTGGAGGLAGTVKVTSTGDLIITEKNHSDGIHAQSVGGGGGDGGFSIGVAGSTAEATAASFSIGGNGGSGGYGNLVDVINSSDIYTVGQFSSGIFSQSVGGGGGSGGFSVSGAVSAESNGLSFSLGGKGGTAGYAMKVSVNNSGDIMTGGGTQANPLGEGNGSHGIVAQSIGGGGGNGGFSGSFTAALGSDQGNGMSVSIGGNGGGGGAGGIVDIINTGEIITTANDSIGIFGQSIGGGGGNGGFSLAATLSMAQEKAALNVTVGGKGGVGGDGQNVTITNSNSITTIGDHSQGIFAQSLGGGGGNGGFSVGASFQGGGDQAKSVGVSVGGSGGIGGDGLDVTVTNTSAITTWGSESSAIQAQSIGGGGGNGGFSVSGSLASTESKSLSVSVGGSGGAGGAGGIVNVLGGGGANDLETHGDSSYGVFAQSIGGGGGNGGFSASIALGVGGDEPDKGSTSLSVSVGGGGGTGNTGGAVNIGKIDNKLTGDITTHGDDASGIFGQSIGGGGGNGGFSVSAAANFAAGQQGPNTDMAISVGGAGGSGNNGGDVKIYHDGAVTTSGDGSYGIQAQSIGGGGGNGGSSRAFTLQLGNKPVPETPGGELTAEQKEAGSRNKSLSLAIGGNGSGGGSGGEVTVDNTGNITTEGGGAHGIFAQSIGGGGGTGGDAYRAYDELTLLRRYDRAKFTKNLKIVVGGSGGSSGSGDTVTVNNAGNIVTKGAGSDGIFAQSVGGGGGTGGTGAVGALGSIGIGGGTGTTGDGGAVHVTVSGSIETMEDTSNGITAQSIGGGGGKAGNVDRGLKNYANVGLNLAFGQDAGGAGSGGEVIINSTADITTHGMSSNAIFAQSVGGGGGVAGSLGNDYPILNVLNFAGSVGGDGSGGEVTVNQTGKIHTYGDASDGIWAQSAGGKDEGQAVKIKMDGDLLTDGAESNAIFAQSRGDAANGNITIDIVSGTIQGGSNTGAAIRIADGDDNAINNHGTLKTFDGISGTAVIAGAGNETLDNYGTVHGSVDLKAGTNTFKNETGGTLESGAMVYLGTGNVFRNAGTISTGGIGYLQHTDLTGDFTQTGDSIWTFDLKSDFTSDLFAISGTANLGSYVNKVNLNALDMAGSTGTYTLVTATSGLTGTFKFGSFTGGTMPAGYTYSLENSDTQELLHLDESSGPFYWRGGVDGIWNSGFVDGVTNWTSDLSGNDFIYGTPGVNCDVYFSSTNAETDNRATTLGADFAINSLTITDSEEVSITGDNSLTLAAAGGQGITVANGAGEAIVDVDLILGASQTWTNNSANLFFVTGDTISGIDKNLTIDGTGTTGIYAVIDTDGGSLTKNGSGTLALFGTNTYTGGTTLNGGVLEAMNNSALGTGNVTLNNGVLATFNDPTKAANTALKLDVGGNYVQATPTELQLRIFAAGSSDQVQIDGTATLSGTLRPDYSPLNYDPVPPAGSYTDEVHILHADGGVTGQFTTFADAHYNGDFLLRWEPVYTSHDVTLLWNQHPFTELPGLTPNQHSVGDVLNRVLGIPDMPTPYNDSVGPALDDHPALRPAINYLNTRPLADLPADYDLIAPEELTAAFEAGRAFTQVETSNIENRLREIRNGGGAGFSGNQFSILKRQVSLNAPDLRDAKGGTAKEADVFSPGADNRWGVFLSGSAESVDVGSDGNAAGFDIDTAGTTVGLDYHPTDHFAAGIFNQYTNSDVDLVNNGSLRVEGDKVGAYATYYDHGFYVNGMVSAGLDSYKSQRAALNGFATGNTGGWSMDALLGGGYEMKSGGWTYGPVASLTYSRQEINSYNEVGSMLPLHVAGIAQDSLASRFGFEIQYQTNIGGVTVVPQLSATWRHEFLDTHDDIISSFANSPTQPFSSRGPETGRDSLDLRAGLDVQWTKDFGTFISYQCELGRTNYDIHSGTIGAHWKF
ncbi:MAG: autotransporter outer membrane beta-barrel domain-containing protein [Luteolibacter sp.]